MLFSQIKKKLDWDHDFKIVCLILSVMQNKLYGTKKNLF